MNKRVVITGYGIICALGNNKDSVKEALFANRIQMGQVSEIKDYGSLNETKVGLSEVSTPVIHTPFDLDKSEKLAHIAIQEACLDAGLDQEAFRHMESRVALSLATSVMGSDYILKYMEQEQKDSTWLAQSKGFVGRLAKAYEIRGGCYTTSSACASGTAGLGIAFDLIQSDEADVVVCGGTDHIADISLYGFKALNTLSKDVCKPFDQERDGINIGEGSAFFIFESYSYAKARGAKIYGEVLGYGLANDAYHITSPEPTGSGAHHSMKMALAQAKVKDASDLYINAHGTGTKANDAMEINAIKRTFGDEAVWVSSTKSLTGHCLGAAGSIEFAFALMSLEEGMGPKTAHSKFDILEREKIRDCEVGCTINKVLSNSFAFGGNGASIVVAKVEEDNLKKKLL